jgi:peptidoglycan/xylan/chitin deacetylase (PgdA/CDA1 family)
VGSPRLRGVRILAYHSIESPRSFEAQIAHIAQRYVPISGDHVAQGLDESAGERLVWVTFDDGDPSIVDYGLDVLGRHGVPATAFICPGVIDTSEPYWWQVVEEAARLGLVVDGETVRPDQVADLKKVQDGQRRDQVDRVRAELVETHPMSSRRRQLTTRELEVWVGAGHTLGNHTWDHPVLDTCEIEEQRRQVEAAHNWLSQRFGADQFFAYPNGNYTDDVHRLLIELGYEIGALFDHRVHSGDALMLSRIRVNAQDPLDEFIARLSGLHPRLYHAFGRV